jgi:hypothetical protein
VLVDNPGHTFLPEDQLAFLTKMLGACKLNIGDVAIVNMAANNDFEQISSSLQPLKIISFGVAVNTQNMPNIVAPPLKELIAESDEAKSMKARLWASLKQMFGV